jgi:mRNA interferase RelE/StbE
MYALVYTEEFFKQIRKLSKGTQKRIISTLERIRIRPYPHLKKLVGSPYFRLRVGDYRVILDIKENKLIIYVLEVGHRRNIYK